MSDYANRLSAIAEKKQKLIEEEAKLVEKRKFEIAQLAEKFDLLMASDELITGLFVEAQDALKTKSDKVKQWESQGAQLIKSKRKNAAEAQKAEA